LGLHCADAVPNHFAIATACVASHNDAVSNSKPIPSAVSRGRRFRLSLRFSLRTFLAAVTLFCVTLGWRMHRAKQQCDTVAAIRSAGGWVYYDYDTPDALTESVDPVATPWEPAWLLTLVGIDFFHDVTDVQLGFRLNSPPLENFASHLARFPRLKSLWVSGPYLDDEGLRTVGRLKRLELFYWAPVGAISDDGIAHLRDMPRLRSIDFRKSQLGDRSLATLARLPNLESLCMYGNRFTDAGLAVLAGHPKLKSLRIGGLVETSPLGDAGVVHLARIPQLEDLGLQYTQVTPEGLKPLQRLPNLTAIYLQRSTADNSVAVAPLFPHCDVYCNQ